MDGNKYMNQSVGTATSTNDKSGPALSLKQSILLFAKYSGLFALARFLTRHKTRVLAYHGIWLGDGHFGNFLYMSADKFAARMALLEKWGYPVVPFTGLPEGRSQYRCPTAITIDDGWYSTWSKMLPVLERHDYPATLYLTTYYCLNQAPVIDVALNYSFSLIDANKGLTLHLPAYGFGPVSIGSDETREEALVKARDVIASLDSDSSRQQFLQAVCDEIGVDHTGFLAGRWFDLMGPEEVKDAVRRGMTIELHTHHHRITHQGKCSLAEEIAVNRKYIEELTGVTPHHFCYPSGRFTTSLWPMLEKCNIASATTTEIGLVAENSPRYAMPRILDGQDVSELEFEAEMCGFIEVLRTVRGVGRRAK